MVKSRPNPVKDTDTEAEGAAKRQAERSDSAVSEQVADNLRQETKQGFRGMEVDPTPNENYTLAGQNAGLPTPETDSEAAAKAREAAADVQSKATGVAER